jgi:hypothetical protein
MSHWIFEKRLSTKSSPARQGHSQKTHAQRKIPNMICHGDHQERRVVNTENRKSLGARRKEIKK